MTTPKTGAATATQGRRQTADPGSLGRRSFAGANSQRAPQGRA